MAEVEDSLAHLTRFFTGRRVVTLTGDVLTAYIAARQTETTKHGRPPASRAINLGTTKNDDGRVVYLTPELVRFLGEQLERMRAVERNTRRMIPALFPYLSGRWRLGQPRRGFDKRWRTACTAAGVPRRMLHDFRRTAVRNLERAGVPRSVAMKLTGHRTESVYRRCAIVADADLREATARLVGAFPGTSASTCLDRRGASGENA